MAIFVALLIVAAVYVIFLSTRAGSSSATEHGMAVPAGDIDAIEYFWRPG